MIGENNMRVQDDSKGKRDSSGRFRRPSRVRERGEGKLKALFWTGVLLLVAYVGYKTVPAYVAEYQLQDKIVNEARFSTVNRRTDEDLRDVIFREIQDLSIPARREDIKIENTSRHVRITVEYTVPVDLFFYHTELHFSPSSENKSLT